jgi:carboxymethylenebutenolidase
MEPTREVILEHGTDHGPEHGPAKVPTLVYVPAGASATAKRPAIVVSPEAFGINMFTKEVASKLAEAGYVVVVPDYYRGHGLKNRESYTEFTEVMHFIGDLDFVGATHDVMCAIDHARTLPEVNADKVVVWGYCTGSTLAMLAASLDRRLAASVLFFPSQPTFPELTAKRPLQPIDLLWNVAAPMLVIYGDQDEVAPPEMIAAIRSRLEQWHVPHQINIYSGAGHAFSAPVPPMRNHDADVKSWADALEFLSRHLA